MKKRKTLNSFFLPLSFLIIFSRFTNSRPTFFIPFFCAHLHLCLIALDFACTCVCVRVCGCNLLIVWCFSELPPSPNTLPVHLCLPLVRLVSWAALEEISDNLALHGETQGHQGGLFSPYPFYLTPFVFIHFLLSSAGQGQSFEDAFPRLNHEAGWRRCALEQTSFHLFFHISLLPHIHFISSSFYWNQYRC